MWANRQFSIGLVTFAKEILYSAVFGIGQNFLFFLFYEIILYPT